MKATMTPQDWAAAAKAYAEQQQQQQQQTKQQQTKQQQQQQTNSLPSSSSTSTLTTSTWSETTPSQGNYYYDYSYGDGTYYDYSAYGAYSAEQPQLLQPQPLQQQPLQQQGSKLPSWLKDALRKQELEREKERVQQQQLAMQKLPGTSSAANHAISGYQLANSGLESDSSDEDEAVPQAAKESLQQQTSSTANVIASLVKIVLTSLLMDVSGEMILDIAHDVFHGPRKSSHSAKLHTPVKKMAQSPSHDDKVTKVQATLDAPSILGLGDYGSDDESADESRQPEERFGTRQETTTTTTTAQSSKIKKNISDAQASDRIGEKRDHPVSGSDVDSEQDDDNFKLNSKRRRATVT